MSMKDMPQLGVVYTADDYSKLGNIFEFDGKQYQFCSMAAGSVIRQYDACYVDPASAAVVVNNNKTQLTNSISPFTYNNLAQTGTTYALFQIGGKSQVAVFGMLADGTLKTSEEVGKYSSVSNGQMTPVVQANGSEMLISNIVNIGLIAAVGAKTSTIALEFTNAAAKGKLPAGHIDNASKVIVAGDVLKVNFSDTINLAFMVTDTGINATGCVNANILTSQVNVATGSASAYMMIAQGAGLKSAITGGGSIGNVNFSVVSTEGFLVGSIGATQLLYSNANVFGTIIKTGDIFVSGTNVSQSVQIVSIVSPTNACVSAATVIANTAYFNVIARTVTAYVK